MKIVVLGLRGFPNIQGGVETHCEHLYTRMAALGHEVIVLGRKPYMIDAQDEYKGVRMMWLFCPRKKFLEAMVHTFVGVLKARRLEPDILHIHAIGPSMLVPLARLLGMTVITTNHGPDYERKKWNGIAKKILRLGEEWSSRFSNGVIAISEPIADHLRKTYRCEPEVIPNGVVVRTPSKGTEVLPKFDLEAGRYLLAVGRLVPEKGFHDLLEAFTKVNIPGWKLVIAGRADHEDTYSTGLQKNAASIANVVMTGFISGEPLKQLYSHAGLFVLPSYHEGLPIVLLEAMSYGLPVIASDIPANRQVGLPDERFFAPGNIDQQAALIAEQVEHPMSGDAQLDQIELIRLNFDWDLIASRTIQMYMAVLGWNELRVDRD